MKANIDNDMLSVLTEAINLAGHARVVDALKRLRNSSAPDASTLTIVVNSGVHHLADEFLRGEVFVASEGSLDLSSPDTIYNEFRHILVGIAKKLKSREWRRVYIVPFGPTPLSMQVKLLVYRICGIESIEVMNVPGKARIDLEFDLRQLVVDSDAQEETTRAVTR